LMSFMEDNYYSLLFASFTAIYIAVAYYFLGVVRMRRAQRRKNFFDALTKSFRLGNIDYLDDVVNLFRGIETTSSDGEYRQGLTSWLQQYLVYLVTTEADENFVKSCKSKIAEFLKLNEVTSPFSDLPDNERNILKDITEYLKAGNKEAIRRKIDELSASIQVRYDDLRQIKAQNRWSVPLAVTGLVLTVIFGLLSIL